MNYHSKAFVINALVLSILFSFTAGPAFSQEKAIELDAVSVTGEKIIDPLSEPTAVPKDHELFTKKVERPDIEKANPSTANDIIKYMSPNLLVSSTNRKLKKTLSFRGNNLSLSLDGFLLQDGNQNYSGIRGDERILDFMGPDIIESVELVKDSTALIYGPLSGGLVMIRSKRPEGSKSSIKLGIGTFNGFNTRLATSGSLNPKTYYFLSGSLRSFGGPDQTNATESFKNFFGKIYHDFSEKDSIVLTHSRDIAMYQTPLDRPDYTQLSMNFVNKTTRLNLTPATGRSFEPWSNILTDLAYTHNWNERNTSQLQLTRLEVKNDFHNPRGVPPTLIGHLDGHRVFETDTAINARHVIKLGDRVIARTGYTYDHYYNPTGKFWWENQQNEDKRHSLYMQAEYEATEKLTLDAGIRYDKRYIVNEQRARFKLGQKYSAITNKWEAARANFSAGAVYEATKKDKFSVRFGRFTVTPPVRDASFSGADLSDEIDYIANAGYERSLGNEKTPATLKLNVFRNKMQNALIEDARTKYVDPPTNSVIMRIFNNQDTTTTGAEAELTLHLKSGIEASLGTGVMKFTPDINTKPAKFYNFGLFKEFTGGLSCELYGRYVGGFWANVSLVTGKNAAGKDVEQNFPYRLGGFWDIGTNLSLKLDPKNHDSDRISLKIRNLFDKKYETEALAPDFGRTAEIGYEIRF